MKQKYFLNVTSLLQVLSLKADIFIEKKNKIFQKEPMASFFFSPDSPYLPIAQERTTNFDIVEPLLL
jgi:hypothetical protein